jgi:hypothetical protein
MQQPREHNLLFEIYEQKKAAKGLFSWSDLGRFHPDAWPQFTRPKPRVHYLKEAAERKKKRLEENTRLVYDYKRRQSCKSCGARAVEPDKFRFFEAPLPRNQIIKRLLFKQDPENLTLELEKRDVYCPKCHYHVMKAYTKRVESLRSAKVPPAPDHRGGVRSSLP